MIRTTSTKAGAGGKFLALLASLAMLFAGLTAVVLASPASASAQEVCQDLSTGHQPGDGDNAITITAPEGKVIVETCVKAGSDVSVPDGAVQYANYTPGVTSVTLYGPGGKDISHWSARYADATEYTATKDLSGTVDYCLNDENGSAPWSVTGNGSSYVSQEDANAKALADAEGKVDAAKAAAIPSGATAGKCGETEDYTATKDLSGTVDYCLNDESGSAPWSVTGNGSSDVSQEDANAKALADAEGKVDAAKAAAIPSGASQGSCTVTRSYSAPGGAASFCVNDAIVNVSWDGASGQSTQEGANNIAAANRAAALSGIPANAPATCTPTEVVETVVEPAVVLPATVPEVVVPAKPKPATVKAPKPAKVDGGVAGKVGAPQTATVPGAVPAGGGSQAPGLPMWALAMIVVGALGAAGAGMQILGSRK